MPRFAVREERGFKVAYLIDAVDEAAAWRLDGEIVEENAQADSWGERVTEVEQVADDAEEVSLD